MEVKFAVKLDSNEVNTLSKAVSILDHLLNDMDRYKVREVITCSDRTYDIDFIDSAAGMMMELLDGVELN